MIRVLIAEDERLLRDAMTTVLSLEDDILVVAQTGSGAEVASLVVSERCDVALLDIDMPGMNGFEAAEALRALPSSVPVVILTAQGRPGYLRRALQAGVRGFVTKDVSGSQLAVIIRQVHAGGRYIDPEVAEDAMFVGECPLGPRELEVLRLAEGGRSLGTVARELSLSEGTVRNYMSAAMSKLGAGNRLSAIKHARSMGWL